MESGRQLVFGEFRLDPVQQQLRHGEETIPLQPRPFAVLQYLAERPNTVVTKEVLLQEVWGGTYVTKAALKVCIQAIRKALREDATSPHYIETIGREGYRFVGDGAGQEAETTTAEAFVDRPVIVGRETEIARLHHQLRQALDGERQLVFVTGEAGIGKSTVVDLFAEQVQAEGRVTIGRGQCIEQYGGGEAYLPLLEALGRLCQEAGGRQFVTLLRQHAPMWLVQLPGVVEEEERKELQAQVQGASRERMLREMAEVYRLKGELVLQSNNQSPESQSVEAETCFHKAIEVARRQEAKSWELRAATSLARLWQRQGKTEEAWELLGEVYNWFTEGFDTADLKDAKALLGELA